MSGPWWTRGATTAPPGQPSPAAEPILVEEDAGSIRAAIAERIPTWTAEWTNLGVDDAGVALVRLFGTMAAPVRSRVNRLPERATVVHLDLAGVKRLPARPATVELLVEVTPGAPGSVLVPAGYQVAADSADDSGDRVTFETERELYAAPAAIDVAYREQQGRAAAIDLTRRWQPFGAEATQGTALWLGLAGDAAPNGALSIGFRAGGDDGQPAPALRGGLSTGAVPPPPLLAWDLLDGGSLVRLEVRRDGTRSLQQDGIVEVRLPRRWQPGRPSNLPTLPVRRWLKVSLLHGRYPDPPSIEQARLNIVPAVAARTIRDEPLTPLDGVATGGRTRMQLSQRPVVPWSVEIEVDPVATDVFGTGAVDGEPTRWLEVDDLSQAGPGDQVFTLDPHRGIVEFGDGVQGRAVPDGFRNVRANRYQAGGGRSGNLGAEGGPTPLRSLPFVAGVDNPDPARGGVDAEDQLAAIARGPAEIRARGRAVAPADYGLLARRTAGAEVARAYAVRGLHPDYAGTSVPGLVCVFVVPPNRGDGPPIADGATLGAVAEHLGAESAPVGVQVVAAAPRFHDVRVEARVQFDHGVDQGTAIDAILGAVDAYLDPLRGGERGTGWEPGGPLQVVATIRHLLATVPGLRAVPQLNFVVDGIRSAPCDDVAIEPNALVWPDGHEIVPVDTEPVR